MAALRVRLSTEPEDRIALQSPYDRAFVDGLKTAIPYAARAWDAERKVWLVWPLYQQELLDYLRAVGAQIQDDRHKADTPAHTAVPAMPEDLAQAFATLHLAPTAPLGAADAVFKFWSRHCHPDVGGDPALFRAANDAIQIIRRYLDPQEPDDDDLPF
jgi:hypothetical protein